MEDLTWVLPSSVVLVFLTGLFQALAIGFMSLDNFQLKVLMSVETSDQQTKEVAASAAKIAPLRKQGNLVLCALMTGNIATNAALSIILADYTSGVTGFVLSTVLIVVFGEIIPQAIGSRYGLVLCSKITWFIKVLVAFEFLVVKPIAAALDWAMGEDVGYVLNKHQMKAMFSVYTQQEALGKKEGKLLASTLDFAEKKVSDAMTPLHKVYMIDSKLDLDVVLMKDIYEKGFSRVPVYKGTKDCVMGVMLAKDLMLVDEEKAKQLWNMQSLFLRPPLFLKPKDSLNKAMQSFKQGSTHLGVVRQTELDPNKGLVHKTLGILTMEDIIECLIADQIEDEHDLHRIPSDFLKRHKSNLFFTEYKAAAVLSLEELGAVSSYLRSFLEPFSSKFISKHSLRALVNNSKVLYLSGDEEDPQLYQRGLGNTCFYLVLSGLLVTEIGDEKLKSEHGPFKYLGLPALTESQEYFPDFTVKVQRPSRVLQVTKSLYSEFKKH